MKRRLLMDLGQGPSYKWWALATVSIGVYMAVLDTSIVNISLPAMSDTFHTPLSTVQWVALSYLLGISAFLLPAGRIADRSGRKRVYSFGFAVFVLGSVLSGVAPSVASMSLFRIVQALGAASLMANGLAITTAAFPGHERGKALGINTTVVALGAITGPTLGGLIVDSIGWRWIFFINAPIGALGLMLATAVLREHLIAGPADGAKKAFDWQGTVLSAAALVFGLLAISQGDAWGWSSGRTLGSFVLAAVSAAGFVLVVRKPDAIIELSVFRRRPLSAGLLASFLVFSGISTNALLMPFYLQRVLGHSARAAGLLILPLPVALAISGPISGRLSDRFSGRAIASLGLALVIVALVNFALLGSGSSYGRVAIWLVMLGTGMGMFQAPNNSAIFGSVPRSLYGVSAALANLARNMGQTIGVAVASLIVTLTMAHAGAPAQLSPGAARGATDGLVIGAFTDGMRNAYLSATCFVVIALLASLVRGARTAPAEAGVAQTAGTALSERDSALASTGERGPAG